MGLCKCYETLNISSLMFDPESRKVIITPMFAHMLHTTSNTGWKTKQLSEIKPQLKAQKSSNRN